MSPLQDKLLALRGKSPEASLERALARYCRERGILWIKQSLPVGIPDRLLVLPNRRVIWVELKTPTGRLSQAQEHMHQELRNRHHEVYVIRTKEEGIRLIETRMGAAAAPAEGTQSAHQRGQRGTVPRPRNGKDLNHS